MGTDCAFAGLVTRSPRARAATRGGHEACPAAPRYPRGACSARTEGAPRPAAPSADHGRTGSVELTRRPCHAAAGATLAYCPKSFAFLARMSALDLILTARDEIGRASCRERV